MKTTIRIEGPYQAENLTVYLLLDAEAQADSPYATLDEGLADGRVVVHETGDVNKLEIENLHEDRDVFIQAGEIVRGGRQDRTFGVDFVIPAKSGRVPIPAFCVEAGRWGRRRTEAAHQFSSSGKLASSKRLRKAIQEDASQQKVWNEIEEYGMMISCSVGQPVHHASSPSSYELTMEHEAIKKFQARIQEQLSALPVQEPETVGAVFLVNGAPDSADVYASRGQFRQYWAKLLDAASGAALAGRRMPKEGQVQPAPGPVEAALTSDGVRSWLDQLGVAADLQERVVTDRIRVRTRRHGGSVRSDTDDRVQPHNPVHVSQLGA